MILPLLLTLAAAPTPQDSGPPAECPELLAAPRGGRVHAASADGAHFVRLVGPEAWLFDGRDLSARLVVGPAPGPWRNAAFSADGARLVLVGMRGNLAWVDVHAAKVTAELGPRGRATNLANDTDADARRVALQEGVKLTVLAGETGAELLRVDVARPGARFALTPGGTRVVYEGLRGLAAQALDGSERRFEMDLDGPFLALFALDEDRVLALRKDGVRLFSIEARAAVAEALWPGSDGWVLGGFSPAAARLALRGPGEKLRVIDVDDLEARWELEGVGDVQLPPGTGSLWAARRDRRVTVHDLETGEERFELPPGMHQGFAPGFLPAPPTPAAPRGGLWLTRPRQIGFQFIDPYSGRPGDARTPPTGDARAAGVLADGTVWVLGARGSLATIDERTGHVLARVEASGRAAYAASAGYRILVLDGGEAVVHEGADLRPRGRFASATWPLLSADGDRALVAVDGALRLVSTATGAPLATVAEGIGQPQRLAWDGAGTTVAALDDRWRARLWRDGVEVELEAPLATERSLAVDPEGRFLALGGGSDDAPHLRVLDATSGRLVAALPIAGWWPFGGSVRVLRFDPAGEFLVATLGDLGEIQVHRAGQWDLRWAHEFTGGNPGAIQVEVDPVTGRLWSWGMIGETPTVFDLASGRVVRGLAGSGLEGFTVGGLDAESTTVAAVRGGTLVVLEADGTRRLEVLDLGDLGRVVADRAGGLRGPEAALRQTFVRVEGRVQPADERE